MNTILEARNVNKVFHLGNLFSKLRITAVDNVSLNVRSGEIFGLAGESGSGKSTLAKMILGFEEPTSGQIIHMGKDGKPISGKEVWRAAGVQAVFQNPFETFNPLRQVEQYFFRVISNYGLARSKGEALERINHTLEMVGLNYDTIAGRYPGEFSGGQLQRVSVARALLNEPSLLIADEPVSMVDASLRMSIMNLFRELVDKLGLGVVYITHDLATAYYVCDRIAIMFKGNIVAAGDIENVLMDPKHPYVQLLRECIMEPDLRKRSRRTKVRLANSDAEDYLRTGCKFAARCPHAMEICRLQPPDDINIAGQIVKCHLFRDLTVPETPTQQVTG